MKNIKKINPDLHSVAKTTKIPVFSFKNFCIAAIWYFKIPNQVFCQNMATEKPHKFMVFTTKIATLCKSGLKLIDIKGCIVTIDAMGCQEK